MADRSMDWRYLAVLFLLVLPLRLWLLGNTEVAALDSIGFIRYALQFETRSWPEVLRGNHQHPAYPLTIWAVSQPVRAWAGTDPVTMRISAQLASTLAALALLVPMYFLGKALFSRQVGFWSALLFQYFPISGHHLSDGISEALFLFLVAMALWLGVWAVRSYRAHAFAWCGFFGGLAYLTRPEGALIVLSTGLLLVAMQMAKVSRQPWLRFMRSGLILSTTALAVGSIYFLTVGHFTNKVSVWDIGNFVTHKDVAAVAHEPGPLFASVFGVFLPRTNDLPTRLVHALAGMGSEFSQAFHYIGWVPALWALCWGWRRFRRDPGFWMLAGYFLFHAVILLLLGMVAFYVSDRHMMVLILCGAFFTVAGVRDWACRLWLWGRERFPVGTARWLTPQGLTGILILTGVVICMPKTMQRLHASRTGNHVAGVWLATRLAPGDVVDDDHAYTHYYAGLVFLEGNEPALPRGYRPTCYTVMTRSKDAEVAAVRNEHEEGIRQKGRLVYQWPENQGLQEARIVIYAQPRDMEKHPWKVAQ